METVRSVVGGKKPGSFWASENKAISIRPSVGALRGVAEAEGIMCTEIEGRSWGFSVCALQAINIFAYLGDLRRSHATLVTSFLATMCHIA